MNDSRVHNIIFNHNISQRFKMDDLTFAFFIFEKPQQFPTKISIKNRKNLIALLYLN